MDFVAVFLAVARVALFAVVRFAVPAVAVRPVLLAAVVRAAAFAAAFLVVAEPRFADAEELRVFELPELPDFESFGAIDKHVLL